MWEVMKNDFFFMVLLRRLYFPYLFLAQLLTFTLFHFNTKK